MRSVADRCEGYACRSSNAVTDAHASTEQSSGIDVELVYWIEVT